MFRSSHQALQFAFRVTGTPIVKMSSAFSMRGASGNGDLTPHDRHAQAAMIMAIVERTVDVNGLVYLRAQYGGALFGGEHERAMANHLVRVVIGTLPTGNHNPRGIEKLVRIYFGQDISMVSVRKDMQCGHVRANEYRDAVRKALSAIGDRADCDVDIALRVAWLVGEETAAA